MIEKQEKKVVIVTGGSRGIGAQIVKSLAYKGYTVVLNYCHSREKAEQIQKELEKEDKKIELIKADVSKREEVKKLVDYTMGKYHKIDVLINNAGIDQIKTFMEITDNDWNNLWKTNVTSVFYCTQEVLPNMIHNKNGCIINISSIWGITGASCEVAYSTSKAAINGFTKALAKELGPSHIRVNAIAPGIINTDMNRDLKQEDIAKIKEEIPLGEIGETIEIAKCVEWLLEDTYTTGQIISINGGWVI